jgi:DNA-binding GntR family transcriptional regulator
MSASSSERITPEVDLSGITIASAPGDRRITADYVADALREAIHRGALADGAVLNQVAIASHFGVSRMPVREAMRQLQAEGLIETRAHRLAIVQSLDLDDLVEIYELRGLIEGRLVERAAPAVDEALLGELWELEAEMREVFDLARTLELNARFHRLLYEPSGAVAMLELVDQLRARAERYDRLWSRGAGSRRAIEVGEEHEEILRLVARGDGAGARRAVEQHVARTRDSLVEATATG